MVAFRCTLSHGLGVQLLKTATTVVFAVRLPAVAAGMSRSPIRFGLTLHRAHKFDRTNWLLTLTLDVARLGLVA